MRFFFVCYKVKELISFCKKKKKVSIKRFTKKKERKLLTLAVKSWEKNEI